MFGLEYLSFHFLTVLVDFLGHKKSINQFTETSSHEDNVIGEQHIYVKSNQIQKFTTWYPTGPATHQSDWLSAVRAAAARGCVLAFAGWWVALATPAQLALFHNFCLCLGLTAEMKRVDNNVKAVIRARARKVSRGAAVDWPERLCSCSAKSRWFSTWDELQTRKSIWGL